MPVRTAFTTFVAVLLLIGGTTHDAHAQSATTFTYQGYLEDGGGPATGSFDFQFELYDSESSGTQVGATVEVTDVTVTDGVFAADLDFGAVFGAAARYLEVGVRDGGATGAYETLSPREALRPAPLATALPYLRVERVTNSLGETATNVIGGDPSNTVANGVTGATIAGGGIDDGTSSFPNEITARFGTIGGGLDNTASGSYATVGGGGDNTASELYATVGGGFNNTASGFDATVGGGESNTASGFVATVPGGRFNEASGQYSFAAGRRAKARNDGTFVWADSEDADFASTADDQFLVRSDFVGINRATTIGAGEVFGIRANTAFGEFGGMYIEATSANGQPYYGYAVDGDNPAYHYYAPSTDEWVLFVSDGSPGGSTFEFNSDGDLDVPGRLTKGSGSFTIDHPQAPTEKTLSHSFVESPDMMNVYNGTVTLGPGGTATVKLPGYFEALNTDFRYQLTPIGAPGPNLHIATEIEGNRFRIAGGTAGMRVSWQVTGIRNDPYARKHRIEVEEEKAPEDRGTYLHPDAYGRER